MMSDLARPELRFDLVGRWEPFDPFDPGVDAAASRAELATHGLTVPVFPSTSRLMLAALMLDLDQSVDPAVPIFSSLTVVETEGSLRTKVTADREIVPERKIRTRKVTWPDPEVGVVKFHEATYLVAYPDAPFHVRFTFTSPNLPRAAELEWIYDSIVGTAEWIDADGKDEDS